MDFDAKLMRWNGEGKILSGDVSGMFCGISQIFLVTPFDLGCSSMGDGKKVKSSFRR